MIVTVLPSANPDYHCDTQLNHTISSSEVLHRVVKIMSGFGLSINGNHVYCGDYIFSGHTMILILCYLIIVDCKYNDNDSFSTKENRNSLSCLQILLRSCGWFTPFYFWLPWGE